MKEGTKHLSHQMCTSLSNQHCCSLSCSGTDTSGAFQVVLVVKNPPAKTGDTGSMPGSGRSPGEGNGNPFLHTCLKSHGQRSLEGYSPWGHRDKHNGARACTCTHVSLENQEEIGGDISQILPEKCGCALLPTPWSMHGTLQR